MRKVAILMIAVFLGLFVAGCSSEKIDAFIRTDVTTAIDSRVAANISIVERLKSAGLLTEAEASKLINQLQSVATEYSGDSLASSEKKRENLFKAVVDWRAPKFSPGSNGKMDGMAESAWYDAHITSYVDKYGAKDAAELLPLFQGAGSQLSPLVLIDAKTGEALSEKFNFEVQVLRPTVSMQNAMTTIASATKSDGTIDEQRLGQIFEGAKDANGKTVKLLDTTDPKYQVVKQSKGSTKVGSDNKVKDNYSIDTSKSLTVSSRYNLKPGVDMVIKSNVTKTDLMAVRFMEFDQEAVDRVISTIGVNPDQYLFYNNKVYVLEYPVFALDKITADKGNFKSSFVKSEVGLNVKTGKLIRKSPNGGVYMESSDPYIDMSSFVVSGEIGDGLEFISGAEKVKVKTSRIVLRDYLEATYMPKVVEGESLVVLGRKVRIKNFSGSSSTLFAEFYDKAGNKLKDTEDIYITDIGDFDALAGRNPVVKRLPGDGEVLGVQEPELDDIMIGTESLEAKDKHLVSEISPVTAFPGKKLGKVDAGVSSKPLFYALTVTASPFDTGLFSGWINNRDLTQNSLGWWQNWLANSNRSYLYRINAAALENYLVDNYTADLQQNGIVLLKLDVIASIQNQMNAENRNNTIAKYRTVFVVIGWGLMVYGMLLMLAWVLDTNVDLGFNLLEKLSFKQMIATKDTYIMGERYVGFGTVAVKALIMLVVGVILISLNVIDVILAVIKMFGGIADIITAVISGLY